MIPSSFGSPVRRGPGRPRCSWSRIDRTGIGGKRRSLQITPVHRNLHTRVRFLGLEFEDLIAVLDLAVAMNLLAHFASEKAWVLGMPLNVFMLVSITPASADLSLSAR